MHKYCKTSKIERLRQRLFFQYNRGNYAGAARIGEALLRAHVSYHSTNIPAYEDDLYNAALACSETGHTPRAVELYTESIHRTFVRLGADLTVAERLTNLAALLSSQDQHEPACRFFVQALTIRKKLLHHNHLLLGDSLYNMGNALIRAGRCREAIPALNSALHIYSKNGFNLTDGNDSIIHCLHVIAAAHERIGEYEEAIPLAKAACRGLEYVNEEGHYRAKYYLASLYEVAGHHKEACSLYLSVMQWAEHTVGCNHSGYINLATKVASQMAKLGEYLQSKDVLLKISKLIEGRVGHNSLTYSNCIRNLAVIHRQLGEWEKAEALLQDSIALDILKNLPESL